MTIEKILIIDDEVLIRDFLAETLRRKNLDIVVAESGVKGLELFKEQTFDVVITDMRMPMMSGIEVLKKVKEISPQTIVILITAFGSIENAVEAMKLGAFNYLIKPFSPDTIEAMIEKAAEHHSLVEENKYLRREVNKSKEGTPGDVIAESPVMKKILEDVARISQSNANVFITGESGTGKEVIARLIHIQSPRNNRPFIKVNCAAIPDTLIESEFFGHEKGSFTGANAKRLGRFELADTGTLLLDEVTEVPLPLQAKLLRVIQEQEFERVGGIKPIKVDVRLVSTSNRNIKQAIDDRVLREDLYYRLNVVPIHLPALRDRREDIIPLAEYFVKHISRENHKGTLELAPESKKKLTDYSWPGNVRELANIIERAVVMTPSHIITPEYLFLENPISPSSKPSDDASMSLADLEKKLIIETLQAHHDNHTKAAEALGISPRTLRNKLKKIEIE